MKKLRFKGEPGTALRTEYDNGKIRFRVGTVHDLPDDEADALLADFPNAFELVGAEPVGPEEAEPARIKTPEKNRMRTGTSHKRGKGK